MKIPATMSPDDRIAMAIEGLRRLRGDAAERLKSQASRMTDEQLDRPWDVMTGETFRQMLVVAERQARQCESTIVFLEELLESARQAHTALVGGTYARDSIPGLAKERLRSLLYLNHIPTRDSNGQD